MGRLNTLKRRTAIAALGLAGCGKETDRTASAVDVGDSRMSRVTASICAQELRCRELEERERDAQPSEQDCVRAARAYFESLRAEAPDCADARLDFEECFTKLSCEDADERAPTCATLYKGVERRCDDGLRAPPEQ